MGIQYSHLSSSERAHIEVFSNHGVSCAAIGRYLRRHRSTVMREVRRGWSEILQRYLCVFGQRHYASARKHAGFRRRKLGADLTSPPWRCVRRALDLGWSPQQLAGRLPFCGPGREPWLLPSWSISHETIYRAIYDLPRSPERTEFVKALRQSRQGRRRRSRGSQRFVGLLNCTPISQRPRRVDSRMQPGHWEGDLMEGARGTSTVIATLVERSSRLVRLVKLPSAGSATMVRALRKKLGVLPKTMRRSLTYDRGTEMAMHEHLTEQLGIKVYFCDAYRPWQRGSNENTNGLLRQYLPKGTDLASISQARLATIERLMNNRPRRVLGYRTPQEVFDQLLQKHAG